MDLHHAYDYQTQTPFHWFSDQQMAYQKKVSNHCRDILWATQSNLLVQHLPTQLINYETTKASNSSIFQLLNDQQIISYQEKLYKRCYDPVWTQVNVIRERLVQIINRVFFYAQL